jgi:hypothetical protein
MSAPELPPLLRAASHPPGARERRALQRAAVSGSLFTVHSGVFVSPTERRALGPRERHLTRLRAAVPRLEGRFVVSHVSALAVHGISCLRAWPDAVHLTDPAGGRGRQRGRIAQHAGPLGVGDIELVDGFRVTSATRTCIDLALTQPFDLAVAALDECLRRRLVTPQGLRETLDERAVGRGSRAALRVLDFASDKSDSGGESWCRCRLAEVGTPTPELQKAFSDDAGPIGRVDFWFDEVKVAVEFDGDQKYLDARYSEGRGTSEILLRERKRERRLLALREVTEVVRVEWKDLVDPWRLRSLLVAGGVPLS